MFLNDFLIAFKMIVNYKKIAIKTLHVMQNKRLYV